MFVERLQLPWFFGHRVGFSHVPDIFAGQEITLGVTIAVTAL